MEFFNELNNELEQRDNYKSFRGVNAEPLRDELAEYENTALWFEWYTLSTSLERSKE